MVPAGQQLGIRQVQATEIRTQRYSGLGQQTHHDIICSIQAVDAITKPAAYLNGLDIALSSGPWAAP